MLFAIGEMTSRSVSEVLDMRVDEIKGWAAYMRIKNGK